MQIFKTKQELLKSNEAKKIVKNYNRMVSALLEFELMYHRTWFKAVEIARSGMNSSLLIRHPETNKFVLNFDNQIYELIDEAKNFIKLELEIPEAARNMMNNEEVSKFELNQLSFEKFCCSSYTKFETLFRFYCFAPFF